MKGLLGKHFRGGQDAVDGTFPDQGGTVNVPPSSIVPAAAAVRFGLAENDHQVASSGVCVR